MPKTKKEAKQPVTVTVSGIKQLIEQGYDRRGIAAHYGLTMADMKRIFSNPHLKNIRSRPTVGFNLIDDTEGEEKVIDSHVGAAALNSGEAVAASPAAKTEAAPASAPATQEAAPAAQPQAAATDKGMW